MLTALWLGTFLVPVDDCLVTNAVLVVKDLVGPVRIQLGAETGKSSTLRICGNVLMIRVSS